jgi:predicted NBD/HSP70 family sugar kinase
MGCLELVAAVPGMLQRLQSLAPTDPVPHSIEDLVPRLRAGELAAQQVVAESGEAVGEVLASLCNALNPRRIVIGGLITQASDEFLASVRTTVYRMARPLATRNLTISHSVLDTLAGVVGGMVLGTRSALSPGYLRMRG